VKVGVALLRLDSAFRHHLREPTDPAAYSLASSFEVLGIAEGYSIRPPISGSLPFA
jgi:hypothetical protein